MTSLKEIEIPEDFTEFLYWVKDRTETFWSRKPGNGEHRFYCDDWAYGAKWIGLEESQIDAIEEKYKIRFTPDHRLFLQILHTLDRKQQTAHIDDEDNTKVEIRESRFFYNWLADESELQEAVDAPYNNLLVDILQDDIWLKSWGDRNSSPEEKEQLFSRWYNDAPVLLPLTSYRFLVSTPAISGNPVLAAWYSDIVVMGWNLRSYLLNELQLELELLEEVFNDAYQVFYTETKREVQAIIDADFQYDKNKKIPYWEDIILYWSTGWAGFGKKYPHKPKS